MTPRARAIELQTNAPLNLFERVDASPLSARHLDEKVERFIIHRAEQEPTESYELVVRAPAESLQPDYADRIRTGVREHFAHRAREEAAKLHSMRAAGAKDLMIGIVFLFICAALGLLGLKLLRGTLGLFVEQGLLIIGWVALWRPVDMFLYELRPVRKRRDLLRRLSSADVQFISE